MKLGELEQRCGDCNAVEYCAEPFGSLSLCTVPDLAEVEDSMYKFCARKIQEVNKRKISNKKMCERICRDIRRARRQ